MCNLTHFALPAQPRHDALPFPPTADGYGLQRKEPVTDGPRYRVVPAGNGFFHIKETSTGRVRGFRKDHNQACALARSLETQAGL
ncbi:hypothetical protein KVG96_13215 [Pseudomonas sp. COR58]|uniref:DUF1508 domain-containing protein n=1 Tax=Pseudomonas ekonensis TaxID=2842353 RepID=A0ABS6PEL4_9PSED|nr:hypothetical protein [Pseudomonas ekonensis]MBV4458915.1 hypothetical protein [Pseudomonas ekonensis]